MTNQENLALIHAVLLEVYEDESLTVPYTEIALALTAIKELRKEVSDD